jgi:hypothetical protein
MGGIGDFVGDIIQKPLEWLGIEGGSSTPTAPSVSGSVSDWSSQLPAIYAAQLKYGPQLAQQQVDLASQYALPLAQAYYNAQKTMYPTTVGLQEQLAQSALTGMGQGLSDAEKEQYRSDLAAQLGTNVGSGIGSDYMSRNMLLQQQNRQDYWRNLALSTAGRQPLTQASGVSTPDYMSNFTPTSVMGYNANNYGTYAGAYTNLQGSYNQMMGNIIGGAMGGGGSAMGAAAAGSSRDIKDNIKDIDINAVDIVNSLKPVEFTYKGEDEKVYGFISEDSPDIITAKNKKAVNLYSCIGVLTKAVQELSAEVKSLKER